MNKIYTVKIRKTKITIIYIRIYQLCICKKRVIKIYIKKTSLRYCSIQKGSILQ